MDDRVISFFYIKITTANTERGSHQLIWPVCKNLTPETSDNTKPDGRKVMRFY